MQIYRALLYFCPAAFRAEYGEEMCRIFAQRRRDTSSQAGVLLLYLEAFIDIVLTALGTHWDVLGQDLRYTIRTLRHSLSFTITAVLVCALGIGATTAAFSLADHVLLRPLPLPMLTGLSNFGRISCLPYKQVADGALEWYAPKDLVVRSAANATSLLPAIRRIIADADPEQPISDVQMMTDVIDAETSPRLTQLRMLITFALIALLLAAIGIHGLLSFAVTNRTQEIGVRIAIGAQRRNILALIMRDGLVLAGVGTFVGIAAGYIAGRAMESLLAGVKPDDALTFSIAIATVLLMTLAGSSLPALRAVHVDPTTAIRAE